MNINYEYYKIFYFVGRYGSFTQAAKILNNNQPNITRIINNLESDLGCRLFLRSKKGVAFTPEGENLFRHIEAAYHQIAIGESEIFSVKGLEKGHISIAISEIALHEFMLPIIQGFKADYPNIRVKILNQSTPQSIKAVESGLAELAVVSSPAHISGELKMSALRTFQEIFVAGKYYKDIAKRKLSITELSKYPLITLEHSSGSYEFLSNIFSDNGLVLESSIEVATTDQILPMVAHDMGIALVPQTFVENFSDCDRVLRLKIKEQIPERNICLIQDKSRPLSTAAIELSKKILLNNILD